MGLNDKYAIVGIGYTPQGQVPGRTSLSFHVEPSVTAGVLAPHGWKSETLERKEIVDG
jgi:hypothetical protein